MVNPCSGSRFTFPLRLCFQHGHLGLHGGGAYLGPRLTWHLGPVSQTPQGKGCIWHLTRGRLGWGSSGLGDWPWDPREGLQSERTSQGLPWTGGRLGDSRGH